MGKIISYIILGYLLFRVFGKFFTNLSPTDSRNQEGVKIDHAPEKDITTNSGEYIDYEEVRTKDQ